ncbi:hypothetical protein LTR37_000189 [Vermiconidia calcicola]|uniref:Uncharacterized protein n=1 Tax=Vermiconidia calcicola TaxID=1690605 RepID=A0ACC3NZS3_9PEZI|nr:hypothetical protein LTR37_000189 [Vermiconidia calcicola]
MATQSITNLQDVRAVAHKLWGQCRDSSSSYKLLTTSVRKLRNVLEEVEEVWDPTHTLGPDDVRLLQKVTNAGEVLRQLDLALQTNRCSNLVNVRESDVEDLKTELEVKTHKLSLALEAISASAIELKLDTDVTTAKPQSHGPFSSNTADSKSSRASSAWSLVNRDNASQSSASETPSTNFGNTNDERFSEEKQVYDFGEAFLHALSPSSPDTEALPLLDWRTPFAFPDPLSISIEQASSIILGTDDALTLSAARSRSGTVSTLYAQPPTAASGHEERARGASSDSSQSHDQPADGACYEDSKPLNPSGSTQSLLQESAKDVTETEVTVVNDVETPARVRTAVSNESLSARSPRRYSESSHLSPQTATKEFGRRIPSGSIASITEFIREVQPVGGTEGVLNRGSSMEATGLDEQTFDSRQERAAGSEGNLDIPSPEIEMERAMDSSRPMDDMSAAIGPAFDSTNPIPSALSHLPTGLDSRSDGTRQDISPPMPARPPPLPPRPRQRRVRKRASAYRVVNAAPSDIESSDDELCTTSKPGSPTATTHQENRPNVSTSIPSVSVGDHDAEVLQLLSTNGGLNIHLVERSQSRLSNEASQVQDVELSTARVAPVGEGSKSPTSHIVYQAKPSPTPSPELSASSASQHAQNSTKSSTPSKATPPPVPKRPERARYKNRLQSQDGRPVAATAKSSPAAIPQWKPVAVTDKELVPEIELELNNKLVSEVGLEVSNKPEVRGNVRPRMSVDAALNIRSPSSSTRATGSIRGSVRHTRAASSSQFDDNRTSLNNLGSDVVGWYAPGTDDTSVSDLERERINHIIHFFNMAAWNQAEAYLQDYLTSLIEQDALASARRVRHLIGVCASFKGESRRSIRLFLSVLRTPMRDISEIDDGDCAAAYWLGDAYSMLNQRSEALLAYCIAERSSLFKDPVDTELSDLIGAEQDAVQLGVSKADFKLRWAQEALHGSSSGSESILDTKVMTTAVAKTMLENTPRKARRATVSGNTSNFQLHQNKPRSNLLFCLNKYPRVRKFHRMQLAPDHFDPDSQWPMMYDPLFAMANVQRGRLLAYECDMLDVFSTNEGAKILKSGNMNLSRVDCFTCTDLNWLIATIRDCLRTLEIQFSEVANVEGTWFIARYSFLQNQIATTHYFSIALFKQTFRAGYGVEICPDGICSARIIRTTLDHEKGVHNSESKRIKKLIRESLEEAARQRTSRANRQTELQQV